MAQAKENKSEIIVENNFAILPGAKAIATTYKKNDQDAGKEKEPVPYDLSSMPWSCWGPNNLYPQEVLRDLEKNSIALRALEKRKTVHFGRGILAYRENGLDENGNPQREPVMDQEVRDFFRINRINSQWVDLIGGLEILYHGWIECILNLGRDKINKIYIKDPAYCRLEKMAGSPLMPRNLYYSAQWDKYPSLDDDTMVKLPMYDSTLYNLKNGTYKGDRFVIQTQYKTLNKSYYSLPIWNGIRESGWISIANDIPRLKKAIMRNQMTIKYHVEIPDDYFTKRYPSPDWTREQREAKRTEVLNAMNEFLSDVENSGKAFVSFTFWSQFKGEYIGGWKITVLDNKLKDDAYLPDSQAANSEILFAIGVDPCLIGSGIPGGALGAGSGSDKREAYWMMNADMGIYREKTLEPLYFIRDFNGWGDDIQFDYIVVDTSQTMDQNPTKILKRIDKNISNK